MKLLLVAALLFSNVVYGQPNLDNNISIYNVSKQHIQQKQIHQKNFTQDIKQRQNLQQQ